MEDILSKIIEQKKIEIQQLKNLYPLEDLKHDIQYSAYQQCSFSKALTTSSSGIIAEFKRKSPSKGWLYPNASIEEILPCYEQNGASACSILTDSSFFGGAIEDLKKARCLVNIPLLRKDFIIDEYQIYEAFVAGANAILLIAACLTPVQCLQLSETAHLLGLEILLEIHQENELNYLNPFIDLLGINNRNLGSFHTDVENSFRLAEAMRKKIQHEVYKPVLISESGISDPKTINLLRQEGFEGFLIGETFMKTVHPGETLAKFIRESI